MNPYVISNSRIAASTRVPYDPNAPLAEQIAQSIAASLRNLETCVDGGQVRQLGISNCHDLSELEQLCDEARVKPAVIQNRFYADTRYDREIRAYCSRNGIIYKSFWTLSANPRLLGHKTMVALASAHDRTAPQILFRYLTQIGIVPLTGTKSESHMQQDLAIFEFELSAAERGMIEQLL
jgi:diketogulonate reductase-like aldo/keto reductase